MVTSDFRPEVEIRLFRACAMQTVIIIGTVRSLWTWLWGRYHVPQNAFLVLKLWSVRLPSVHNNNNNNNPLYSFVDKPLRYAVTTADTQDSAR